MNGHELWRLRELGIGGSQVQRQGSNFWSKYNCPVLQWTAERRRHGFDLSDTAVSSRLLDRGRRDRDRITLPVFLRDSATISSAPTSDSNFTRVAVRSGTARPRAVSPSEPPSKQMKLSHSVTSQQPGTASSSANASVETVPPAHVSAKETSNANKGDWYFISSGESLRESCAALFPQFAQEHHVDLGHSNKIFAARWLPDDRIVMGTKCNSILVMDANHRKPKYRHAGQSRMHEDADDIRREGRGNSRGYSDPPFTKIQPLKSSGDSLQIEQNCGIHAIDVNPSGSLFASGGDNPADVSVFRLPNFEPLAVGEMAHSDWLFDLEWLDDEYLVSGKKRCFSAILHF